jgi:hypothetical protein
MVASATIRPALLTIHDKSPLGMTQEGVRGMDP